MTSLVVTVEKVGTPVETLEFSRSPIRIGRRSGNDVHLPLSFVSDVHAEVEFDDLGARFVDLGSTNGSFITGRRIPARLPIAIEGLLAVDIGAVRLTFERPGVSGAFAAPALSPPTLSPPTIFPLEAAAPAPTPEARRPSPPTVDPPTVMAGVLEAPAPVAPVPVPAAAASTPALQLLARELLEQIIDLRRAYERIGVQMGVRTFLRSARSRVLSEDDPARLLHSLLSDPQRRSELSALLADMAEHHSAMLDAILAGGRAVAELGGARNVDPAAIEAALFGPTFAEAYASGRGREDAAALGERD